ncbi:MAG: hypothetical protein ACOCSN_05465 [Halanaeroarchaeum sp.]
MSASEDYDTITLSAGENRTIRVESGETWENKLIDCTASNTTLAVIAKGTNWTIKNIGIKGEIDTSQAVFGIADSGGGTSTIAHVYCGDGLTGSNRAGPWFWADPRDHTGHINIRRVYAAEANDNGFYLSAPGNSGSFRLRTCFARDNRISHYRLAKGTVVNCVAAHSGDGPDGRGVWAWSPGEVEVKDCNLAMNGRHYSFVCGANGQSSQISVTDTRWDSAFHGGTRIVGGDIDFQSGNTNEGRHGTYAAPVGVPTSPDDAASGTAEGWDGGDDPDDDPDDEPDDPPDYTPEPDEPEEIERADDALEPLVYREPESHANVMVARGLDEQTFGYVWFETTDTDDVTTTDLYGDAAGSSEGIEITADDDEDGYVRWTFQLDDADSDDPDAPGDDRTRKAVKFNGRVLLDPREFGERAADRADVSSPEDHDGSVQLEVNGALFDLYPEDEIDVPDDEWWDFPWERTDDDRDHDDRGSNRDNNIEEGETDDPRSERRRSGSFWFRRDMV